MGDPDVRFSGGFIGHRPSPAWVAGLLTWGLVGAISGGLGPRADADPVAVSYDQGIDLDTGGIGAAGSGSGMDVTIGYHADRAEHVMLLPVDAAGMAFLPGTQCENVIVADLGLLTFSAVPDDQPVTTDACVVVQTDLGAFVRLALISADAASVVFDLSDL
jgi:hypothetical protein